MNSNLVILSSVRCCLKVATGHSKHSQSTASNMIFTAEQEPSSIFDLKLRSSGRRRFFVYASNRRIFKSKPCGQNFCGQQNKALYLRRKWFEMTQNIGTKLNQNWSALQNQQNWRFTQNIGIPYLCQNWRICWHLKMTQEILSGRLTLLKFLSSSQNVFELDAFDAF